MRRRPTIDTTAAAELVQESQHMQLRFAYRDIQACLRLLKTRQALLSILQKVSVC